MSTRGEHTRARILEVALPLFAENGFAGTSIRMIAQAADCNVATLAYHFTDKQGLYNTVVQKLHEDLAAAIPAVQPGADPRALLREVVETVWAFASEHRVHIRLAVRHVLDAGAHPDVIVENWAEPLYARADMLVGMFRPEWNPAQRRLLVISLQFLVARFVLEDPEQLATVLGVEDPDAEVIDWLEGLVIRELGLPA